MRCQDRNGRRHSNGLCHPSEGQTTLQNIVLPSTKIVIAITVQFLHAQNCVTERSLDSWHLRVCGGANSTENPINQFRLPAVSALQSRIWLFRKSTVKSPHPAPKFGRNRSYRLHPLTSSFSRIPLLSASCPFPRSAQVVQVVELLRHPARPSVLAPPSPIVSRTPMACLSPERKQCSSCCRSIWRYDPSLHTG